MATDPAIVAAAVAGVPSVIAAVFAYRASSKATRSSLEASNEVNRIAQQKVDGEVFERSQLFYEKVLANAEAEMQRLQAQVDRLHAQLDRVNAQLVEEQETSAQLRVQVRSLQDQMAEMEKSITTVRLTRDTPPEADPLTKGL